MNPEQNPLPPVAPVTQPMVPAPEPPKPNNKIVIVLVVIVILLVTVVMALVFAITQMKTSNSNEIAPSPTPQAMMEESSLTPEATESVDMGDWKTYNGKNYTFKYPLKYSITEDNGANVTLSSDTAVFLAIYPVETLTYQNFLECSASVNQECLVKFMSQSALIQDTTVDGRKSKSFYTTGGGLDNDYHRVEVTEMPKTGFNAFIGDISRDKANAEAQNDIFHQILSTFQFTD